MIDFFMEGGWGMWPVLLFGFFFFATSVLSVMRPGPQWHPRLGGLGALTLGAGALGTSMGIMSTAHFLQTVPAAEQLVTAMAGIGESVHVLALSLLLFIPSTLVATLGLLRRSPTTS